jgi:hypothetical protein
MGTGEEINAIEDYMFSDGKIKSIECFFGTVNIK